MKGANDLTADLMAKYDLLKDGKLDLKQAKQIANLSGKIINSAKSQLLYNIFMERKQTIPFFEDAVSAPTIAAKNPQPKARIRSGKRDGIPMPGRPKNPRNTKPHQL